MAVAHISLDLRSGYKGCHRVHDHNIHRSGTHHRLCDLESLLSVIRLGYVQVIDVHSDILRIYGIQRVLRVDESCDAAPLLYLGHHMQGNGGLTAGFRSVDLHDTSLGNSAHSQGDIQSQGTCGHGLHLHMSSRLAQLHHGSLAVLFLNMAQRRFQSLLFLFVYHINLSP